MGFLIVFYDSVSDVCSSHLSRWIWRDRNKHKHEDLAAKVYEVSPGNSFTCPNQCSLTNLIGAPLRFYAPFPCSSISPDFTGPSISYLDSNCALMPSFNKMNRTG